MDGTDSGTGQHGDGGLRDHRQVQRDAIAFLDAAILENVGELADLFVQFTVGDLAVFVRVVAFPDDGDLVAAGLEVAVEAVVGDVEGAALEPIDMQVILVERPVECGVPFLEPGQVFFGLLAPEAGGIIHRALVHFLVLLSGDICLGRKLCGYGVSLDL